jgi:formylglycine-generating enzyme required for sulfatase activity
MDRNGAWTQDANLYRPSEIPPGCRLVSGGPFVFGGEHAGGGAEEAKTTEDVFVATFPVTAGDYLEFLNALCASGRQEEARKRQPREGDLRYFAEADGAFRLPPSEEPKTLLKGADYPVFGVSWFDATAYLEWRSKQDGIPWTLMHEEEWEKAARGVDARVYPYGADYDGSYSHSTISIPGKAAPMPVGSFTLDESPCGIRDLGGGVQTWLFNAPEVPWREWCCLRGGSWSDSADRARAAYRRGNHPSSVSRFNGFRVAARPRT